MSYIDTSASSQIIATLTRKGRQLLSTNSSAFSITKFSFGDDEIDYTIYVGDSPDSDNSAILSTPILEPTTNGDVALRWGTASLQFGTNSVAQIQSNLTKLNLISSKSVVLKNQNIEISGVIGRNYIFNIKTLRGYDAGYYLSSNNDNVRFENDSTSFTIGSYADRFDFDNFQRQSASDFKVFIDQRIASSLTNSSNITIKGINSGALLIIPVRFIQASLSEATIVNETEQNISPGTESLGKNNTGV